MIDVVLVCAAWFGMVSHGGCLFQALLRILWHHCCCVPNSKTLSCFAWQHPMVLLASTTWSAAMAAGFRLTQQSVDLLGWLLGVYTQ
jgi:hypothetical protein